MTKVYIVEYESAADSIKGYKVISAETVYDARKMFFQWIDEQASWSGVQQLKFKVIGDNLSPFTVME